MFWKKETDSLNRLRTACFKIFRKKEKSKAELFEIESEERRKWYRIRPSETEPVLLSFEDKALCIRDIGAAGFSFENDNFSIGPQKPSHLNLPESAPAIPVHIVIISIDNENICHCEFKTIEEGAVERIHQYVLRRQKEILQEQKIQAKRNRQAIVHTKSETDQ